MLDKKRRRDSPRLMPSYVTIVSFPDCLSSVPAADFTGYLIPTASIYVSQLKDASRESVIDIGYIVS